jgi:DNA-binding beta-propeller fold protein YncE
MESRYRLACALASLTIWTVLACGTADAAELYGSDTNFTVNTLVKIDPATGSFQTIGPFNFNVQGLAYAPDLDQLYGLSAETRRVYRINRSNAATTPLGTGPHPFGNANGLAYDSRRHRLIASSNSDVLPGNSLFAIDPVTGAYTSLATITGANDVEGLGYDPATDTLFGLADLEDRIVSIDPVSGTATTLAQLPPQIWRGLEYDAARQVFYATASGFGEFYEIALTPTPTVRFIGFTSPGTQGLAMLPEPAACGWFIGATVLLSRQAGRRRKPRTRGSFAV